ncbi:hypothetical protein TRIATDRAFT_281459 [Trichoderma atroviride IMI 206040]|uniref:Uncharacterized protein n=1 Tax=Hypocrea atroviridis (strain ATCC 20476 / IMI 206040) TaxID=452589 RepID=G9NL76_HYPAI|nr:uncharacterized protein TRIATDRAFT_281459 [Trichoderma atroviride IMI 206040]EHK48642.1 hypothetical protein TRIATDRAFT_281459 [Trichoderma atroviride IMI 206040]
MECYIDNKDGLKDALEMLNERAGEASRASDIARVCNDNNVAGLERSRVTGLPPRSRESDKVSLITKIDKLKREYGVKAAVEPEDSWEPWMQNEVEAEAPELELFSPFSQQELKGPARGQSQTWQKEHLRSSDPLQREIEELLEEPSSVPRRSNRPRQYPSRPASFNSVLEQRNLQKPQPSQPRSRAALSRSVTSGSQRPESPSLQSQVQQWKQSRLSPSQSGSQPSGSQRPESPSFQSQVQQWQQSRSPRSQSGSQPSGSQPSGSQPSGRQPSRRQPSRRQPSGRQPLGPQPLGLQLAQLPPPGSQRSLSQQSQYQRSQSQISQSQRCQPQQSRLQPSQPQPQGLQQEPMQYKPAPQLRQRQQQRQQQRTHSWPRNQELQGFAAHSLSYVPEAPREESAPSIHRPVETATYELNELPESSSKDKGKGKDKLSLAEEGRAGFGQDAANDAEEEKKKGPKPFCSIRGHCVIGPFPGWKNWFTRRGDDP